MNSIDYEHWWNSEAADAFRAAHEDMHGDEVRPVWDAAVYAMREKNARVLPEGCDFDPQTITEAHLQAELLKTVQLNLELVSVLTKVSAWIGTMTAEECPDTVALIVKDALRMANVPTE